MKAIEKKRVLVVDDQQNVCESVREILVRKGHEVEGVMDADSALARLDEQPFDLVVADLMMPRKTGMDLLRELRGRQSAIPFVMITGYASIPSAVEAAKLGVSDYLPKPFTPDELTQITEKALAEKVSFPTFGGRIDEDVPFERSALAGTTPEYADRLTRTDIPLVSSKFCPVGRMECGKFEKKGACQGVCVILAKRAAKGEAIHMADYVAEAVDADLPFNRRELVAATSPSYVDALDASGMPRAGHWKSARIGKRILVINGEKQISDEMRASLTRSGYSVDQAADGETARKLVASGNYDLVITEQKMPGVDGIGLTRELKASRPDVGVVMISSYASIEGAVEAIQAGALEYAARPARSDEIRDIADRAIREAAAL